MKVPQFIIDWLGNESFILKNGQWVGLFLVIFAAYVLERITRLYILKISKRLVRKHHITFLGDSEKKIKLPISVAVFSITWIIGVRFLQLPGDALALLTRGGYIALTVSCVLASLHIIDIIASYFENLALQSENKFDDILIPLIKKTTKFFVVVIGIIFIGNTLTIDMKSVLAGLGIGGIAIALAAKDTLSNLFGSITVLLDRPFRIGDMVKMEGNIEGFIEDVGLRSTRIRTFYDSLITVPNGKLTNAFIDNFGQRTYRRFETKISVQYDTHPEKIEAFCEGIRQIIANHRWTRKDYFHVYLNEMGAHSLDILVYVYWQVSGWSQELAERHRLLIDILRLGNDIDIRFAFPTQTLHMYKEDPYDNQLPEDFQPYEYGKDNAHKVTANPITMREHRSGVNAKNF